MNIEALLATTQSQGQSTSRGAEGNAGSAQAGGFLQALGQASNATSDGGMTHAPLTSSAGPSSSAEPTLERITQQLKELGLSDAQLEDADMQALMKEIRQQPDMAEALQQLIASLGQENGQLPSLSGALSNNAGESTPLDEIADRMNLMAEFSGDADTTSQSKPAEWRQALNDLMQGNDSPDEALAGLLSAMVQASDTSARPSAGTLATSGQGQALTGNGLNGALLAAHNGTAQSDAQSATTARQADPQAILQALTPETSRINVSSAINVSPSIDASTSSISEDALLSALTASRGGASAQQQPDVSGSIAHSLAGTSANPTAGTAASGQASINTPLNSPAWPQQLGQQLAQFTHRGGEQQIQLQIHPEKLGPLSVSLKVGEHGGTQAHFLSGHAQVRQVVEQAIPQLRDALADQGITLGDTSVGEQQSQGEPSFAEGDSSGQPADNGSEAGGDITDPEERPAIAGTLALDGRVDLYA